MTPNAPRSPLPGRPVQRKVFDVMRPGRTPAASTSKPVIVSHKPMIQDPSVTVNGVGEPRNLMDSRRKITITPTDAAATPETLTPAPTPASMAAPAAPITPSAAPSMTAVSASPDVPHPVAVRHDPQPLSPPVSEPSAPVQSALPAAQLDTPAQPLQPPAPPSLQPAVIHPTPPDDVILDDMPAPIVEDHAVVAGTSRPVGPQTFPWKTVILIVAIVLLAVAVLDILLDGDFISWNVPHTHFL